MAIVTHCDRRIMYLIDIDSREYKEVRLSKYPDRKDFEKNVSRLKRDAEKDTRSNTVDTGETKDFFGLTAKHLTTTINHKSEYESTKEEIDGWYIDLLQPGCAPDYMRQNYVRIRDIEIVKLELLSRPAAPSVGDPWKVDPREDGMKRFIYAGFTPDAFAVREKRTRQIDLRTGKQESFDSFSEREVVEFSTAQLDASLFSIPAGFKKVDELYQHKGTGRR
jgi:hypothetical protein